MAIDIKKLKEMPKEDCFYRTISLPMQRIIDMLKGSDKAYHVTELTELLNADKAPGEGDLNKTFVSSAIQRISSVITAYYNACFHS